MPSAFISVWALDCTLVAELFPVIADLFQSDGSDDLTHVPCKESTIARLKSSSVIFKKFFIASWMPSGSVMTRTLATASTSTPMKSWVGNVAFRLDIDGDLADDQLIHPLQKGDLDTGLTDEHLGVLPQAGDEYATSGGAFT